MHLTRKTSLQKLTFVPILLLGFALVGCPEEPQGPRFEGAGSSEPRSGGTFVFHHESNVDTLDPHLGFNELASMNVRLMYEGLLDYNRDSELVPRLAAAMPTMSDDGRTFRFRLRRDVRFHPSPGHPEGRPLVAADVLYSMRRLMSEDLASPGYPFYKTIVGAEAYHHGESDEIPGIRVIDDHTIEFLLEQPDQTFLNAMAMTFSYPINREHVEANDGDIGRAAVGVGPMVFESWERGVQITYRRNPHYYAGGAHPDRMIFQENLQRNTAVMRFRNGDLDAIHRQTTQDFLFFRGARQWHATMEEHAKASTWGIIMNTEVAPFDDVRVRQALSYAIDRESWARARSNRISSTGQAVPPNVWGFAEDLQESHHMDRDRARALLREAGYENGIPEPIELSLGEGDVSRIYGELFQSDMATIGIQVELRQMAFATYLQQASRRRGAQAVFGGWNMDFPDAASFFDPLFHSDSIDPVHSQNKAFYNNPVLDDLLDRARAETNRETRHGMYRHAAQIVCDDAPWAFIFNDSMMEVWQPYVKNYHPHPVWGEDYRDVWLDLPRRRLARRARTNPTHRFALGSLLPPEAL